MLNFNVHGDDWNNKHMHGKLRYHKAVSSFFSSLFVCFALVVC